MNRNLTLEGMRIKLRRVFKGDTEAVMDCFKGYDCLFYNPITPDFLQSVLLQGQLWGAFCKDELIACCYIFPLNSSFYQSHKSYESVCDFIKDTENYMNIGYIGFKDSFFDGLCEGKMQTEARSLLCRAFLNTAELQAFRQGYNYLLYSTPAKLFSATKAVFDSGFCLVKMRGFEKLVVHYVFSKPVFPKNNCADKPCKDKLIPFSDTKKVSALLENGYLAFDFVSCDNTDYLSFKRLIAD